MGETAKSLFRRGLISPKEGRKLGVLKGTKSQPANMTAFDDKSGRGDQGGRTQSGQSSVASSRSIDQTQKRGSRGMPSKGGSAGAESQPIRRAQIDDGATQRPAFPRKGSGTGAPPSFERSPTPGGGKPVPSKGKKIGTPSRARGPIAAQGGNYGGGGRNTQ